MRIAYNATVALHRTSGGMSVANDGKGDGMLTNDELKKLCREKDAEDAKAWARDQVKKRMEQVREDVANAFDAWLKLSHALGSGDSWDSAREAEKRVVTFLDEVESDLIKAAEHSVD